MSGLSLLDLLRDHIGHRCTIVEPTPARSLSVRCIDCSRLIDLSAALGLRPSAAQPTSTSTSTGIPLNVADPSGCPEHQGNRAGACGPCRSEQLEGTIPTTAHSGTPMPDDFRTLVEAARTPKTGMCATEAGRTPVPGVGTSRDQNEGFTREPSESEAVA